MLGARMVSMALQHYKEKKKHTALFKKILTVKEMD